MHNVKSWVNEEYTSKRTGIYFIGWKLCKDSLDAEVVIFYNENNKFLGSLRGLANMGQLDPGLITGHPLSPWDGSDQ